MKCDQCRLNLEESQVNHFQDRVVCEDSCFELLNPPKVCDPLTVSSTLSVRKQLGQTGIEGLSDLQKKMYDTVAKRGKISEEELMNQLNLSLAEMERESAVLRQCELIRVFREGSTLYFSKFSP